MATQPVLSGNTLAWPNSHKRTRAYRGGAIVMADGTQVTDLVNAGAKHVFELTWTAITSAQLDTIRTAFDAVKNASASYTDLNGSAYTVTLDGMFELDEEAVIATGGPRYNTKLRLREV